MNFEEIASKVKSARRVVSSYHRSVDDLVMSFRDLIACHEALASLNPIQQRIIGEDIRKTLKKELSESLYFIFSNQLLDPIDAIVQDPRCYTGCLIRLCSQDKKDYEHHEALIDALLSKGASLYFDTPETVQIVREDLSLSAERCLKMLENLKANPWLVDYSVDHPNGSIIRSLMELCATVIRNSDPRFAAEFFAENEPLLTSVMPCDYTEKELIDGKWVDKSRGFAPKLFSHFSFSADFYAELRKVSTGLFDYAMLGFLAQIEYEAALSGEVAKDIKRMPRHPCFDAKWATKVLTKSIRKATLNKCLYEWLDDIYTAQRGEPLSNYIRTSRPIKRMISEYKAFAKKLGGLDVVVELEAEYSHGVFDVSHLLEFAPRIHPEFETVLGICNGVFSHPDRLGKYMNLLLFSRHVDIPEPILMKYVASQQLSEVAGFARDFISLYALKMNPSDNRNAKGAVLKKILASNNLKEGIRGISYETYKEIIDEKPVKAAIQKLRSVDWEDHRIKKLQLSEDISL